MLRNLVSEVQETQRDGFPPVPPFFPPSTFSSLTCHHRLSILPIEIISTEIIGKPFEGIIYGTAHHAGITVANEKEQAVHGKCNGDTADSLR